MLVSMIWHSGTGSPWSACAAAVCRTLVMAEGTGLVDFTIIPHVEYDDHYDVANAEKWAGLLPVPTYAIDDQTAVTVIDGTVEIVSEGHWKLFNPRD